MGPRRLRRTHPNVETHFLTMGLETLAYIAIGLSAIGTGVSVYSQNQQANAAESIARFNAAQQERNARLSLMTRQAEANFAKRDAEMNFKLRAADAEARFRNAQTIQNQIATQDRINRANVTKKREENARFEGTMRANIAASGLIEQSGTPADLLAEAAGIMQRDLDEQHYEQGLQRDTLFREAALERLGGQMALAGATLNRDSALAAASLNASAARAGFLSEMRGAQIGRYAGAAQASTYRTGAWGTLFSGLSNAGMSAWQVKSLTPKSAATPNAGGGFAIS